MPSTVNPVQSETSTLLLDRAAIRGLMRSADYLAAVRQGFLADRRGEAFAPPPMHLPAAGGGFHAKGAILTTGRRVAALKLNANFPANPARNGLPTIQGAILLHDAEDGRLLAILDSSEITLRRTAAASALAAQCLARPDSATLAVCGCGGQAAAQIEALAQVLPLRVLRLWDTDPVRAEALAASLDRPAGMAVEVARGLDQATLGADVIVTCTTANEAFLSPAQVSPGTFVAAVGADSPDKSELAPALMASGAVYVDSLEQCLAMGDLRHAVAAGAIAAADVRGELAGLLAGDIAGRSSPDEICLFDSTGTALQDVASALLAYERVSAVGAGVPFSFA